MNIGITEGTKFQITLTALTGLTFWIKYAQKG